MLTITNNTTGEVIKISHDNKEGLKPVRDILMKWFHAYDNVTITNETKHAGQFD